MKKICFINLVLFVCFTTSLLAQSQQIKDLYWDYTVIRTTQTERPKAITTTLDVLKRSSELSAKQIANATYHLGRLYEETNQMNLAIPYYEKSIKLTPGYYVPYLALGNHYFKDCQEMVQKMNAAVDGKNLVIYNKLVEDYKKLSTKTAFYLEKSYACDPDESTKSTIIYLYQSSKNNEAFKTFDARIKKLTEDCVTLLDDE
ncbi:tetratricopeptide repeat protein [Pedobacter aquatilis]|uniref:tetratricopeptide repeat protein n=1 Tax=Pedobacter aquatilis TaxID=351343 RepID=UPI0029304F77|nr:tetratricopeptide repeat protein [Pedobacter aquatilis]